MVVRVAGARRGPQFSRRMIVGTAAEPPETALAESLLAASLSRPVAYEVSVPIKLASPRTWTSSLVMQSINVLLA